MAYALDLDPNKNLRNQLPTFALSGDSLSLSFHAASRGVTYTVETSTDLVHWHTEGVSLSELDDISLQRTASISRDGPQRFLRLVVTPQLSRGG